MRPKKHKPTGSNDLFRARLDQIINPKHELVQLACKIDWGWIDGEVALLYSENGRPGIETRFMIGLLLLKHIYGLSDDGICERWVGDPYFQFFTGEEFFRHALPHERSDLSYWRKRLGDKLERLLAESLRVAHEAGALRSQGLRRVTVDTTAQLQNGVDFGLRFLCPRGVKLLSEVCAAPDPGLLEIAWIDPKAFRFGKRRQLRLKTLWGVDPVCDASVGVVSRPNAICEPAGPV